MGRRVSHRGVLTMIVIALVVALTTSYIIIQRYNNNNIQEYTLDELDIDYDFLTINSYSRPGIALNNVNGIVIHYTGNPGSTAKANRDYFENLQYTQTTKASSHFVIGLEGEIIQCIPLNEIAYASNTRNSDTIAIECCHEDSTGKFNNKTYKSLQNLVRALMETYNLDKNDILRHYDITGKECPKYFVDHEDAWEKFLDSL
ncbi:MAG: peptidoglycan recognition protein family protein [Erysipelotrichaceae bacterium]|nr:peptidoglycan recognition protein family protein [Erysipelotrichaceae bacterium]